MTNQSLFTFEQAIVDAELAAAHAKVQAKLAAQAQRAILKRQAEIDKNTRRFRRVRKHEANTPNEYAQCGINWYCRSPLDRALGRYQKDCRTCGQLLIYTSDPAAKPQECVGRKSLT
jgi:hypothetical protein